jgi:Glucose-6-phosphate dehydrogenase, C-terminal domain/Cytochrome bd terminal oxidase subunit I
VTNVDLARVEFAFVTINHFFFVPVTIGLAFLTALLQTAWLFARQDTVEAAWQIVDPVLGDVVPVHPYARGSWGPKEADRLLPGRDTWHDPAG